MSPIRYVPPVKPQLLCPRPAKLKADAPRGRNLQDASLLRILQASFGLTWPSNNEHYSINIESLALQNVWAKPAPPSFAAIGVTGGHLQPPGSADFPTTIFMRPKGRVRFPGQLKGSWMRALARCDITRATNGNCLVPDAQLASVSTPERYFNRPTD